MGMSIPKEKMLCNANLNSNNCSNREQFSKNIQAGQAANVLSMDIPGWKVLLVYAIVGERLYGE